MILYANIQHEQMKIYSFWMCFCIFLLVQQDLLAAVQCQQERSQLEPRLSHTPVPPGSSLQQSGPLEQSLGTVPIEVERVSNLIHIKSLKKNQPTILDSCMKSSVHDFNVSQACCTSDLRP